MLKLSKISKTYLVADTKVEALKGVDLQFRKNEFVSVLGPSGCGKTTLLNIIGGLDKYTSGNLYIGGVSTKQFTNHDWDVYRNHRIGFIFQSYNLIPHQTILGNVELALTIAGISKEERVLRAKKAIDRVGLAGQYNKHPNQLSGGQCQRVAIARALVNEPDILLADEPTGALDTQTSIQIMDLIKEISSTKLVIMVTHNPQLAEKYSTRIVNLLDGEVTSDSNPFSEEEEKLEVLNDKQEVKDAKTLKKEKAKMSFFTSFRLSLRNLLSKKARTIMTCFAGSIGIIGVSAVLAVSSGVKGYINNMQDDMLSGNPVTISESAYDLTGMMSGTSYSTKKKALEKGFVNVNSMIDYLIKQSSSFESMQIENNITEDYINYCVNIPSEYASCVSLNYGLDVTNNIYTDFKVSSGATATNVSLSTIKQIYTSVLEQTQFSKYASYVTSLTDVFAQAPSNEDYILSQYDIMSGSVAKEKNEVMIVIDSKSELTDLVLAQLGYYTQDEFLNVAFKSASDSHYTSSLDKDKFSYQELIGKSFVWYPNDTILEPNASPTVPFTYNAYKQDDFANGMELTVTGILMPKDGVSYGCLQSGFYYTEALAKYSIESAKESKIVKYLNTIEKDSLTSTKMSSYDKDTEITTYFDYGITYKYNYTYFDQEFNDVTGYFGSSSMMSSMMSLYGISMGSGNTITLRELGGCSLANSISIYPVNFEIKDDVTNYLDAWNNDGDILLNGVTIPKSSREKITYTDNLAIIISLVNSLINIVTTALICFTALSLVVSCVMIGIITYVSVVERVKEIGVIRSLGGRKSDVSNLFNAETFIIGLASGVIGVLVTYLLSIVLNVIVKSMTGIYPIANLPWYQALIMILVSVVLTLISGFIPARSAAKKDPVVALRTE